MRIRVFYNPNLLMEVGAFWPLLRGGGAWWRVEQAFVFHDVVFDLRKGIQINEEADGDFEHIRRTKSSHIHSK